MEIDKTLLKACEEGDRVAQSQLYKRLFSLLMGVCVRYVRNEAEAVALVNTGFLKIVTNLHTRNISAPFEAWARRVMINTVIDEFRKNRTYKETIQYSDLEETIGYQQSFDVNEAERKFDAEDLMKMIRQLPEMTGKVFNLFAIDGFSHKEISESLGMAVNTSKWHVSDARKKLREMILFQKKTEKSLLL